MDFSCPISPSPCSSPPPEVPVYQIASSPLTVLGSSPNSFTNLEQANWVPSSSLPSPTTPTPTARHSNSNLSHVHQHASPLSAITTPSSMKWSSPIVGTKEEQRVKTIEKRVKKRVQTMEQRQMEQREQERQQHFRDIQDSLKFLDARHLSFGDVADYIFDPTNGQATLQWEGFFRCRGRVTRILNWWISPSNSRTGCEEVKKWAVQYVSKTVKEEARHVTEMGFLQEKSIDEDVVAGFSYKGIYTTLTNCASVMTEVFESFATSTRQKAQALAQPQARAEKKITIIVSAILAGLGAYSQRNNLAKRLISLYLYATGTQRQPLAVLARLGLTESYSNLVAKASGPGARKTPGTLQQLSQSLREKARQLASTGVFGVVYDNINFAERVAQQTLGHTTVIESGTCATIWPLHKANLDDMKLEDLQESLDAAPPLSLKDVIHTPDESRFFHRCLIHCVLRIIVNHGGDGFAKFKGNLSESLPTTPESIEVHKTFLHPLPAWKIDESTIVGNAEVVEAIVQELHLRNQSTTWMKITRIMAGDQLSIARLRTLANIRSGHEGGYTGFGWGYWMPGLFHAKIADMHGFFVTHWGKANTGTRNPGCLAFHNTRLRHFPISLTSLPTFRICRDLVFVSLYSRVLHCLLLVSGHNSLERYQAVENWEDLEKHAGLIIDQYASTRRVTLLRDKRAQARASTSTPSPAQTPEASGSTPNLAMGGSDMVLENAILFLRDALISREFTDAVKAGDSGRVMLVLKIWAFSFRGSGRTKYAYEMLHIIHNMSNVWPKKIVAIILNNWLLNPTGKPNSFVEVDLVQEHINFWIKIFYKAHGSGSTWEWLEMISPCVCALRRLANSMKDTLGSKLGNRHAPADLTNDIKVLMESLAEHKVYSLVEGRKLDEDDSPSTDIISTGMRNLTDGTLNPLSEYNTAFRRLQKRRRMLPLIGGNETLSRLPQPLGGSEPGMSPSNTSQSIPNPADHNTEILYNAEDIDELDDEDLGLAGDITGFGIAGAGEGPTLERISLEDVAYDMDTVDGMDEFEEEEEDGEFEGSLW